MPLPSGRTVPLSQFATFDYEQDYPLIWRRDRVPTLTVQADVAPGMLPETVVSALDAGDRRAGEDPAAIYRIAVGGTVEESREVAGLCDRRRAADAADHGDGADGPAAELPAPVYGAQRRAARPDRRCRRPAARPASRSASLPFSASSR